MTTEGPVRVERRGAAAWVILDRPPLNILNIQMLESLNAALARIGSAKDVAVVALTGAGKAFCAGVDVADHMGSRAKPMLESFHAVIERVLAMGPPVVAVVNGAALGGGCELLMACDLVVARAGAKLGQPEVRLGVFPPAAAALLPRLIGRQRALDLILTGRTIEATEAHVLGLVTRLLPDDGFDDAAQAIVMDLASLSPPVLKLAKKATLAGRTDVTASLDIAERLYTDDLMRLADAHEGLLAFVEKRTPVWKGK